MSRTTENLHVRGVRLARVVAAVESRLRSQRFARVPESRVKPTDSVVKIVLRREGKWTTIADPRGFGGFGAHGDGDIDGWGRHLSRELDRSVLAMWTWDGEQSLIATRWKRGEMKDRLELLRDAHRDDDGVPRAPAQALWPWLPKRDREALLRDGFPLVMRARATGDVELDKLLEGFEDVDVGGDEDEKEGEGVGADPIHIPLETCVHAIGAAVGLKNPALDPHVEEDGVVILVFSALPRDVAMASS
jgi:hypothetical protein